MLVAAGRGGVLVDDGERAGMERRVGVALELF
jgi:hypothetical protein